MTKRSRLRHAFSRRTLLTMAAAAALTAATGISAASALTDGGKVVIGAFIDGGLAIFKSKMIPLAK
jgi:hypothetical protein